jgi:hypothetical protein
LITADAMKLVIARAGATLGAVNRLMEGVLTAGFARGESMITAKTVAAVSGPVAVRPHHQTSENPGVAAHVMQMVAIGLLMLGTSVFLYRGLSGGRLSNDRPTAGQERPAAKPVVPDHSPAVIVTPPKPQESVSPGGPLPPELMAALMKRGDQSLALGDVAAARLLYRRAAEAGNAQASTALGKTYDPNYTAPGQSPDPVRATEWYQKAIASGDPQAAELLKNLAAH